MSDAPRGPWISMDASYCIYHFDDDGRIDSVESYPSVEELRRQYIDGKIDEQEFEERLERTLEFREGFGAGGEGREGGVSGAE